MKGKIRIILTSALILLFAFASVASAAPSVPYLPSLPPTPGLPAPSTGEPSYNLAVNVESHKVVLDWSAPSQIGFPTTRKSIMGYYVYRSTSALNLFADANQVNDFPVNDVRDDGRYFFEDTTPNGAFYYGVQAVYSDGLLAVGSTIVTVTVKPYQLTAMQSSENMVHLTWYNPMEQTNRTPVGYNVYRGASTNGLVDAPNKINANPVVPVAAGDPIITPCSYYDGRNPGTYYYAVQVVYSDGTNGAPSDPVSVTVTGQMILPTSSARYDLSVQLNDKMAVLTWKAPANPDGRQLAGFDVYRSEDPDAVIDPRFRRTQTPILTLVSGDLARVSECVFTFSQEIIRPGNYYYGVWVRYKDGTSGPGSETVALAVTEQQAYTGDPILSMDLAYLNISDIPATPTPGHERETRISSLEWFVDGSQSGPAVFSLKLTKPASASALQYMRASALKHALRTAIITFYTVQNGQEVATYKIELKDVRISEFKQRPGTITGTTSPVLMEDLTLTFKEIVLTAVRNGSNSVASYNLTDQR
jgi:type VI protein secretion system component Hcp